MHIIFQKIYNCFTYQYLNVQLAIHAFEFNSCDIYMTHNTTPSYWTQMICNMLMKQCGFAQHSNHPSPSGKSSTSAANKIMLQIFKLI